MHTKIKTRGNKLWLHATYEGKFCRYPSGLDDTKDNLKWLSKNATSEFLRIHNLKSGIKVAKSKDITLEDFAIVSLSLHQRKENTNEEYAQIFKNFILPSFVDVNISDIKVSDCLLWQNEMLKKNSAKTVKNKRIVFNTILNDALNDGLIIENPFKKVSSPSDIHRELDVNNLDDDGESIHTISPFSSDEIKAILGSANGWFKNFVQIAFFSGMRTGELMGLRWSDINFVDKKIKIRRSIRKDKITTPKTLKSIREIDMLPLVEKALIAQKMHTYMKNGFIFVDEDGGHFKSADKIREQYWYRLLKVAKVDRRILYQTRHTFASQMLANGEDLVWVSHMLGHTDIHVTSQRYVKYIKSEKKVRASFLDSMFENDNCTIVAQCDNLRKFG